MAEIRHAAGAGRREQAGAVSIAFVRSIFNKIVSNPKLNVGEFLRMNSVEEASTMNSYRTLHCAGAHERELTMGKAAVTSGSRHADALDGEMREERLRRHQQNLASLQRMQVQVAEWEARASFDPAAAKSLAQVAEVLKEHRQSFDRLRVQLLNQLERRRSKRRESVAEPPKKQPAAQPKRVKRYV